MNTDTRLTNKHSKRERGTTQSYVIGFVLSLVFTLIPYDMVTNKILAGDALLIAILGVAVVQMFIQIFFFLHLGRGPKPLYNVVFFFATAGLIVIVVAASLIIMDNLYRNMAPEETIKNLAQDEGISQIGGQQTGACQEIKASHVVTISGGTVSPIYTSAHLCDTLTFVNKDNVLRDMAFGPHPNHEVYGGETDEIVRMGRPKTITLNELGDFIFHDHLDPTAVGYFSVKSE